MVRPLVLLWVTVRSIQTTFTEKHEGWREPKINAKSIHFLFFPLVHLVHLGGRRCFEANRTSAASLITITCCSRNVVLNVAYLAHFEPERGRFSACRWRCLRLVSEKAISTAGASHRPTARLQWDQ